MICFLNYFMPMDLYEVFIKCPGLINNVLIWLKVSTRRKQTGPNEGFCDLLLK